jgi:hypothetical protein
MRHRFFRTIGGLGMPSASRLLAEGPVHASVFEDGDWDGLKGRVSFEARR